MSLFDISERAQQFQKELLDFVESDVYPAEAVYEDQMRESGDPHFQPPIIDELKNEARTRGLWNLFHPHPGTGAGLTNLEYAPLAEIMGRSFIAPEACNCSAPDTGNMEVLELFGTEEHREKVPKAAAGRRHQIGVRDDRAAGGQLGCHQRRIVHGPRRRRLPAQWP